jgi:signal transduction histidine kinase
MTSVDANEREGGAAMRFAADSPPIDILVIEDDPDARANLGDILELDSHSVTIVGSAAEALDQPDLGRFSVIILDRQLPDGTAEQLMPKLKVANPNSAIIVITGYSDLQGPIAALQQGATDYILKPLNPDVLRSSLRRIAERRQLVLAKAKNIELENANKAKDRFLASMSHELRTPLNAIIGFTGTLLMRLPGPLNTVQEKQLRTIQTSSRHLLSLINDMLDLAKIESGKVVLKLEPVLCRSVLDEVAAALRPLAQTKGLEFRIMPFPLDLTLHTDRRAYTQILLNLTSNAIKFTEKGSITLEVDQYRMNESVLTKLSVVDTGIGMQPPDQAKLFQAFEQAEDSGARRHEGSGLGLHLSQKLAHLLGGHIDFTSQHGKGSTFSLVLEESSACPRVSS